MSIDDVAVQNFYREVPFNTVTPVLDTRRISYPKQLGGNCYFQGEEAVRRGIGRYLVKERDGEHRIVIGGDSELFLMDPYYNLGPIPISHRGVVHGQTGKELNITGPEREMAISDGSKTRVYNPFEEAPEVTGRDVQSIMAGKIRLKLTFNDLASKTHYELSAVATEDFTYHTLAKNGDRWTHGEGFRIGIEEMAAHLNLSTDDLFEVITQAQEILGEYPPLPW